MCSVVLGLTCTLIQAPSSTVAVYESRVLLTCESDSHRLSWLKKVGENEILIYNGFNVEKSLTERYYVNNTRPGKRLDLIITNIQFSDAATYYCKETGTIQTAISHLAVIGIFYIHVRSNC